jgi:hypothetical protein
MGEIYEAIAQLPWFVRYDEHKSCIKTLYIFAGAKNVTTAL